MNPKLTPPSVHRHAKHALYLKINQHAQGTPAVPSADACAVFGGTGDWGHVPTGHGRLFTGRDRADGAWPGSEEGSIKSRVISYKATDIHVCLTSTSFEFEVRRFDVIARSCLFFPHHQFDSYTSFVQYDDGASHGIHNMPTGSDLFREFLEQIW